ncbi:MAG: DnaJ domain-containing protein [Thermonemataceae bacterium]|nr:DnaJ domain-containing protein [Thermonemataceae bacterium]
MKNYYTILDVPESASAEMIKNAYRTLAKRWHPDVNPNDQTAEQMFLDIKEAYATLSNAIKRNFYDYQLRKEALDKKVQATSNTNVGSFRKQQNQEAKAKAEKEKADKEKEKVFYSSETYKNRLDDLMKKHNDLLEKQKKAAQKTKEKEEKEKTFYDTFKENRDNAYAEQQQKKYKKEEAIKEEVKEVQNADNQAVAKPQKNRIKAILSILGFRSD